MGYNYDLPVIQSQSITPTKTYTSALSFALSLNLNVPINTKFGALGISTTPNNNTVLIGNGNNYSLYNISSGLKIGSNNLTTNVDLDTIANLTDIVSEGEYIKIAIVESPSSLTNAGVADFLSYTINLASILQKYTKSQLRGINISCGGGYNNLDCAKITATVPNAFNIERAITNLLDSSQGAAITIKNIYLDANNNLIGSVSTGKSSRIAKGTTKATILPLVDPYSSLACAEVARNEALTRDVSFSNINLNDLQLGITAYKTNNSQENTYGKTAKSIAFIELQFAPNITLDSCLVDKSLKFVNTYGLKRVYKNRTVANITSYNPVSFGSNFTNGIYTIKYVDGSVSVFGGNRWEWGGIEIYGRWYTSDINFYGTSYGIYFDPATKNPVNLGSYTSPSQAVVAGRAATPFSFFNYNSLTTTSDIYTKFYDSYYVDNITGIPNPTFDLYEEAVTPMLQIYSFTPTTASINLVVAVDPIGGLDINTSSEIKVKNRLTYIDESTYFNVHVDGTGSMDDTRAYVNYAINLYFAEIIKEFFNGNKAFALSRINLNTTGASVPEDECFLKFMTLQPPSTVTGIKKVVNIHIGDEAEPLYYSRSSVITPNTPLTSTYITDIATVRNNMATYGDNYFRCIVFQIQNGYDAATDLVGRNHRDLLSFCKNGLGNYAGVNGLSDKNNFSFIGDIKRAQTPSYYAELLRNVLVKLS